VTAARRRLGRLLAASVSLVAVGLLATACSPPHRMITAIYVDGTRPTALFHPCSGEPVYGLGIRDVTSSTSGSTPSVTASPAVVSRLRWDVGDRDKKTAHTEVALFTVPAGWTQQTLAADRLTELEPDRTYELKSWAFRDAGLQFSVADLTGLDAGEVWAPTKPNGAERAMTRDEFIGFAEESCRQ
jgi:hypothetical protein